MAPLTYASGMCVRVQRLAPAPRAKHGVPARVPARGRRRTPSWVALAPVLRPLLAQASCSCARMLALSGARRPVPGLRNWRRLPPHTCSRWERAASGGRLCLRRRPALCRLQAAAPAADALQPPPRRAPAASRTPRRAPLAGAAQRAE
eukprot:scaffold40355_cov57-Phaeocystis_antarctica.AAC.2